LQHRQQRGANCSNPDRATSANAFFFCERPRRGCLAPLRPGRVCPGARAMAPKPKSQRARRRRRRRPQRATKAHRRRQPASQPGRTSQATLGVSPQSLALLWRDCRHERAHTVAV
jgi:hypothetical protein